MPRFHLRPIDGRTARLAVVRWHYSGTIPVGKMVKFGLWEEERFIGAVVFSTGTLGVRLVGRWFEVLPDHTAELSRVALGHHTVPVSQIVPEALRLLRVINPSLRLIISYADPSQGHIGRIYQAMNWAYLGRSAINNFYFDPARARWIHNRLYHGDIQPRPGTHKGAWVRNRTLSGFGLPIESRRNQLPVKPDRAKFRYAWAWDKPLMRRLRRAALPYPGPAELAEEVSKVRRRATRPEGRVRSPGSALIEHDALTLAIRAVLTPDLLRPEHHQVAGKPPTFGHSYVAAEAYYHLAGGAELGLTVYHVRHEGTVHWWLQLDGVIIDPTGDQFTTRVPYEAGGRAHFLPPSPSARARTLMARIAAGSESV